MNASRPDAVHAGAEAIARCRRLLEPALREAVSVLHPSGARMAGFALGWSDVDGRPFTGDGGKHLRPAIAMLSAEAVGAPPESALPGAVAVELVHAFSLVHDDIMDLDERRRHRPTLWRAYGAGPALLAGDAMLALAIDRLAGTGVPMAYLSRALVELVQGQTLDLAFESRPWRGPGEVTIQEYEEMAAGKTGSLLGAAAATGVALGGAPELAERAWEMGREFGVAFQIYDDILGIWGDPAITGKPVHGDLRRGKKTLPIIAALSAGGPAARELSAVVGAAATDEEAVRQAARLVEEAGGRQAALDLSARRARGAMKMMAEFLPGDTALRDVCGALIDRIR
ncbi:polyprenyl synthetase family protein [Nonomuraea glycinis]|uniref:polyprenyl synthetase family protein n=1 Tax=Nonomuraea glycinis TaxID=2047744 RepID=UPI002E0FDE6F|nr:polyprenyl synthetase family protein [Nonomuraea glycinis]